MLEDSASSLVLLYFAAFLVWKKIPRRRNSSPFAQRLYWQQYSDFHTECGTFKRRLRMSKSSFNKLLGMIRHKLEVNQKRAKSRGGAIIPELCLYCTLRYLAGGSYLDICDIAGISRSSFYRVIWKTMRVINQTGALRVLWPRESRQLNQAISDFTTISKDGAINNCVGAIDGYLLRIKVPT